MSQTCYDYSEMDAGYDAADDAAEMAHDAAEFVAAGRGTKAGAAMRPETYERRYSKAAPAALLAINNGGDYEAAKRAARAALRN